MTFKYLIYSTCILIVLSCRKSNENEMCFGIWNLDQITLNGENIELNNCELESYIDFKPNGKIYYFYESSSSMPCPQDSIESANWYNEFNSIPSYNYVSQTGYLLINKLPNGSFGRCLRPSCNSNLILFNDSIIYTYIR